MGLRGGKEPSAAGGPGGESERARQRPRGRDGPSYPGAAGPAALAALEPTRHLRAFRPQHVAALRGACEDLLSTHSEVRQRLRRGQWVIIDIDQTPISANGRTYQRTARGHFKKKGNRG